MKITKAYTHYNVITKDQIYEVYVQPDGHMNITSHVEQCDGVLRHWGSAENLIKELDEIKDIITQVSNINN